MAVISTTGLTMRFGAQLALDDLDLVVPAGVTGLVGANGAGKTTLLSIVLGLRPATSGSVEVLGLDPIRQGARLRAEVGFAPERNVLPADMRAVDFVRHLAEVRGLPKSEARSRASDSLWLTGLGEERFRALGTMSTGQRQRVKLAQAIAHDPQLILLDEPTDGLDPIQRDAMLDLIRHIATEFDIDVILSSHLLDEVERICDSAVIVGEGVTLASGTLDELRGSGTTGVVLEVDGDQSQLDSVIGKLTEQGLNVSADGRRVTVEGDDERVFDLARDACAMSGAGIARLNKRRLSLEDVFIERMG
jgi:ABC-2 type transport system ATP-binding protein